MAGGTHSQGAFGAMLLEPTPSGGSPTFDASSHYVEFLRENIAKVGRHGGYNGIRGSLSEASERVRELAGFYSGEIHMYVSPNDIAWMGDELLGFTESPAGTFTSDDASSMPYFALLIDRDHGLFQYDNCMVDYWQIRGRAPAFRESGEPDMVLLTIGVIGCSEEDSINDSVAWPVSPPSIGVAAADAPYKFQDTYNESGDASRITINSVNAHVEEFVFRVSYNLKAKYTNSLKPHSLRPRRRRVEAKFRVPWNSTNQSLYRQAVAGAQLDLDFFNGNLSTQFQCVKFQVPDRSPTIPGKDQVSLTVQGVARMSSTTRELVIVNDNTP
jgi:hypothetical protein